MNAYLEVHGLRRGVVVRRLHALDVAAVRGHVCEGEKGQHFCFAVRVSHSPQPTRM